MAVSIAGMEKVTKLRILGFISVVCMYIGSGLFSYSHRILTDYDSILNISGTTEIPRNSGAVIGVDSMPSMRLFSVALIVFGVVGFFLMMSTDDKVALREVTDRYRLQTSVTIYFIAISVGLGLFWYATARIPNPRASSLLITDVINSVQTDLVHDYIYYNIWKSFGVANVVLGLTGYIELALRPSSDVGFKELE